MAYRGKKERAWMKGEVSRLQAVEMKFARRIRDEIRNQFSAPMLHTHLPSAATK
jgi:hypothetical protein